MLTSDSRLKFKDLRLLNIVGQRGSLQKLCAASVKCESARSNDMSKQLNLVAQHGQGLNLKPRT